MENNTKNEGIIKDVYEIVLKEIQSILTVIYVLMIGIGMLFKYKEFGIYGINIFEYADIFDFLITPFQDYRIIFLAIFSAIFPILLYKLDQYSMRRFPKTYTKLNMGMDKKKWYRFVQWGSVLYIYLFLLFEVALGYAQFKKRIIHNKASVTIEFSDKETLTGKKIGKTKDVLFILSEEKVKVIPLQSLVKIINYNRPDTINQDSIIEDIIPAEQ